MDGFSARFYDGKRLTTLQLVYRLPDHPHILQEFFWQTDDIPPGFPRLKRFLAFWRREIEAPIHSVTICYSGLIGAGRVSTKSWLED